MSINGQFSPCAADRLSPGSVILDGNGGKPLVVAEVIHRSVLGKIHVSPGKVKIRIKGAGNLWVCDAGHEFMTKG